MLKISRPILYAIGVVLALLAAWWLIASLTGGKRAQVEAKLNGNLAGAAVQSGQDAVNTVGRVQASEVAADAVARQNETEIRNAQGSDARVDPAARDAAIAALCRRASYAGSPRCVGVHR